MKTEIELDEMTKKLLQFAQDSFPLTTTPFAEIASKFGLDEEEVVSRFCKLKEMGVIRRIAPAIDVKKMEKRVSTLIGMKVLSEDIEKVAEIINGYKGVTHNYERAHEYNIWFTLSDKSEENLKKTLEEIKKKTGIHDVLNLHAVRFFKLGVRFQVK